MNSLRHKLTVPLLLVVVGMVALHSWLVYDKFSTELRNQTMLRGQLLLKSVNYSLENVRNSQDLIRVVQAFGAERDIVNIVLAMGSPLRVVATNRMSWMGRLAEDLPSELREDLQVIFSERAEVVHLYEYNEHRFHMGRMVVLILDDRQAILNRGALVIHLNASDVDNLLREMKYSTFGILTMLTMGPMLLIWLVLRQTVFHPLRQVITAMARRASGDATAMAPVASQDEIGQVATAYNDMLCALANHEATILAEKERAELFLETSEALVVGLDLHDRITLINQWGCRLLGYASGGLVGKNWFDMAMSEPQRQEARRLFHTIYAETPSAELIEVEIKPIHDPARLFSWNLRLLRDKSSQNIGLLASGLDISRRVMAEQALRDSEEQFRSSFENAPFGMCLVGLDQTFLKVNTAFCQLAETTAEQVLGRNFFEVLAREDEEFQLLPDALTHTHTPITMEMAFCHVEDHARWATVGFSLVRDARGNRRFFIAQVQNITDRKIAEAEILHRMTVEKSISLASQDLLSRRDPYYTFFLSSLAQAIGADRACVFQISSKDDYPKVLGNWFRPGLPQCQCHILEKEHFGWLLNRFGPAGFGGGLMVDDVHTLPEGGTDRNFLERRHVTAWICLPIRYSKGELQGFIAFDRLGQPHPWRQEDVTAIQVAADMLGGHWERLETEEEKLSIQERAMRTAHLASLGMLSAGVAHEINNPNNLILFNAPLLKKFWDGVIPILLEKKERDGDYTLGGLPVEQVAANVPRLLTGIQDGTHRIQKIVSQLKRLVRSDQGGREEAVEMVKLVQDALSIITQQLQKRSCILHLNMEDNLPPVRGTVQELEQVFLNVVVNAMESLGESHRNIWIQVSRDDDQKGVVLSVKDEGMGIPTEILLRITEPLFTTKSRSGGTGLGLAISKNILDKYGGRLEIVSREGQGTTVNILLSAYSCLATLA